MLNINKNNCRYVIRKNKSLKNLNIGGGVFIYIQENLNFNTLDNLTYSRPDFVDIGYFVDIAGAKLYF